VPARLAIARHAVVSGTCFSWNSLVPSPGLPHLALRLGWDKLAIHCGWDCFHGASLSVDIDGERAAGEGLGTGTEIGHAAPAGNVPPPRRTSADVLGRGSCRPELQAGLGFLIIQLQVGTAMAANSADEQLHHIRQPQASGPAVGIDHNRMRAFVVAAYYVQSTRAGPPHLSQGDLLVA
jgi:hypothetical protein